jgi:hypothetical protein
MIFRLLLNATGKIVSYEVEKAAAIPYSSLRTTAIVT